MSVWGLVGLRLLGLSSPQPKMTATVFCQSSQSGQSRGSWVAAAAAQLAASAPALMAAAAAAAAHLAALWE